MKMMISLLFVFFSQVASAGERAVSSGTVSLVQIKAETAEVPATIVGVTGSVDLAAGTGTLTIPVSAWDSELEIRNNNVRNTFFQVAEHPSVTFSLESLALTDGAGIAKGTLSMYSGSVPVQASVSVSEGPDGVTAVKTTEPFFVSISALGLSEPLKALMKLCAHPSVSDAVQVSLSVTLAKE